MKVAESEPGWAAGPRHPPGNPQSPVMLHITWALGWLGSCPSGSHGHCNTQAVVLKSHHHQASEHGGDHVKLPRSRDHIHLLGLDTGCLCPGLSHRILTPLWKIPGFERGRACSTLSGGGPRQGHPRRPAGAAVHLGGGRGCVSGAKGCPMDERPRPASNENRRKGEKTFKESSLLARSCRRRAHTRTHNVLRNF